MFALVFHLILQSQIILAKLEDCTENTNSPPTLKSGQDFCLFKNYSKFELAKSGYDSANLKITLNFTVQDVSVDQNSARWHSAVLLNMEWPDHRILLQVKVFSHWISLVGTFYLSKTC